MAARRLQLVAARVGRPHGVRGEVTVQVRTDDPGRRFLPGARFGTEPAGAGPLTVHAVREHRGRLLLRFAGVTDRSAADALHGVLLLVEVDPEADREDDAWYPEELVGLRVQTPDGTVVGRLAAVRPGAAQDLLVVARPSGREVLVPFVRDVVPVVDLAGGLVVIEPPEGLLADEPGAG